MNNDVPLVNETDDAHFARALGADKRTCFVDLSDKVGPAFFLGSLCLLLIVPGFIKAPAPVEEEGHPEVFSQFRKCELIENRPFARTYVYYENPAGMGAEGALYIFQELPQYRGFKGMIHQEDYIVLGEIEIASIRQMDLQPVTRYQRLGIVELCLAHVNWPFPLNADRAKRRH